MRVGFETSNLYPEMAGVYTYSSQLLTHLARLADAPTLVLVNGLGRGNLQELSAANEGMLPAADYAKARLALPLLHMANGPWKKDYRTRHLAYQIDSRTTIPLWRWADTVPMMARLRLPRGVTGHLDVCHWSDNSFLHLPRVAHVATIHDTIVLRCKEWHTPEDAAYHTRKLYEVARHATRIIAVSEQTRRDAVDLLGIPLERIDVIPEAASPALRPPTDHRAQQEVLARYGLRDGDYIFYVGTIEPRKNLVRLATAFKVAVERSPELTTRLVLAGRRGWLTGPIDAGLQALGLGDRLLMPGRVPFEDLPALLHGARAVGYVSLYEGFGLPPLEAMACGTPVVASYSSSIPEVVGDAGLLVDPYDVHDIATALHRIMTDDALRADLAQRGLRRAQQFSWIKTAELTMETYCRAITARQQR